MSTLIKPTVGRVVWYWPKVGEALYSGQPLAALITFVHSDICVNLAVFDANGNASGRTSVSLIQNDLPVPDYAYCEWMPYQKAVAKGEIPPTLHDTGLKNQSGSGDANALHPSHHFNPGVV